MPNDLDFKSSNYAIIFFDISGYTDLLSIIENNSLLYEDVSGILARLFREVYKYSMRLGGIVANRMGDGLILLFDRDTPSEAVDCALHFAAHLKLYYQYLFFNSLKELKLRSSFDLDNIIGLKIALHFGRVYRFKHGSVLSHSTEAQYDYISHHLNLCARIMNHDICRNNDFAFSDIAWKLLPNGLAKNGLSAPALQCVTATLKGIGNRIIYACSFDDINWYSVDEDMLFDSDSAS